MKPFFSIIVVCLNPGEKLKKTLESIQSQTFRDYEVIVKDGMSNDGSLACIAEFPDKEKVKLIEKKDQGIYDAMNQATALAEGEYIYYLNCGDLFYSEEVLGEMQKFIRTFEATAKDGNGKSQGIYYGNIYERLTGQKVASNPHMDTFGCYRNVPCHQACFYGRELLLAHPFQLSYKVRADYEQFLWCFFAGQKEYKVRFAYVDMLIADYEGGGFSETKENRKISAAEHKEITEKYMSKRQLFRFRMAMLLSLAGLRSYLAENKTTAGIYNKMKSAIYVLRDKKSKKERMERKDPEN